jgi:hypothetical protein
MVLSPRAANLWVSRVLRIRPYGRLEARELAYARLLADAESAVTRAGKDVVDGRAAADALARIRDAVGETAARAVPSREWQKPRAELIAMADAVALVINTRAGDRALAQEAAAAQQRRFRDALDRAWRARVQPWRGFELM